MQVLRSQEASIYNRVHAPTNERVPAFGTVIQPVARQLCVGGGAVQRQERRLIGICTSTV